MADSRFFKRAAPLSLSAIAQATGALIERGDATMCVEDVAPLSTAGPSEISFLDNVRYADVFAASRAGACFVRKKFVPRAPQCMALLVTDAPYTAFAIVSALLYPPERPAASVHPSAVIGQGVTLGEGVVIEPHVVIYDHVNIGAYTHIGANSTISHAIIGAHVRIHRGVHIGQDGFGFAPSAHGAVKVPQLGRVIIEDHVEIGSGTCIDRGAGPDTIIGAHSKIDNLVQIGHNVRIGRHVFLAGQVGIAGSCTVEDGAMLGGQVGLGGHLTVGAGAKLAAQSGVMGDVPAGETSMGTPAMPIKAFFRQVVTLKKLTERKELHDD